MQKYKQISYEQRITLDYLLKEGISKADIAKKLNVHRSTVYREIGRNSTKNYKLYNSKQANNQAVKRKLNCGNTNKITNEIQLYIDEKLKLRWSPDEISNRGKLDHKIDVSHETIYKYVYDDKKNGGVLYGFLRQAHRVRRKRKNKYNVRGQIKDRVSIDERPKIVDKKSRIGDFEGDTIIGKNHQGAIATMVDRKTLLVKIIPLESKNAKSLSTELIAKMMPLKDNIKTITFDNGKEFAEHKIIADKLNTKVYFAHPYSSYERGCNENTNGLIRQYLPKKTDFTKIENGYIEYIENELNNRPRKKLGYKTPNEVFYKNINKNFANST